ncbi:acyltransferase family protein [Phenylobacterium montanum]|uniref:Acyltransferase n=1 Tax=Phenylobacterium montanum TaxID=2823693 RepID=A0A975G3G9_9CAUL|nr:acyltransferase [Caulobacter sp. S6]QUD89321.1 acyltransferase [Caulobacter sp. S6]
MHKKARESLDSLQALRACAALLVVIDHCMLALEKRAQASGLDVVATNFGGLGVDLFFVISGFVMIYAHGEDFGAPRAPALFALRRIGRIVPLYWLFSLVALLSLSLQHERAGLTDLLRSWLFVPYKGLGFFGQPILGQGWTLNYEMLFYLVFGLSLLLRRGLLLLFLFFIALRTAGALGAFPAESILGFWSRPIVLYFLFGILIGLLRQRTSFRLTFPGSIAIALIGMAAAFTSSLYQAKWPSLDYLTWALTIATVAACCLARPAQKGFGAAMARLCGDATYSTYLAHTLVVGAAARLVARLGFNLSVPWFIVLVAPLAFAVGVAIYRLVERPLLKLWSRWVGRGAAPARTEFKDAESVSS